MNSDDDKNIEIIEADDLNAEKELRCTKKGIERELWPEVDGCLNKFLIKFQEQDNNEEDVLKFKAIFLEISELLDAKKIPDKDKRRIYSTMEHINRLLEL